MTIVHKYQSFLLTLGVIGVAGEIVFTGRL